MTEPVLPLGVLASAGTLDRPGLCVAIALAVGVIAQSLARKLQLPGLLLLLVCGVALGPDGIGIITPDDLGDALPVLVGFAVAVILFEGGLNLNLSRLRREQRSIQMLISVGAAITMIGAAVAARYVMSWPWPVSWLFGSLVIVTGPTVIGPLLKRLKVKKSVATVLEAEGVLIDAVGAITAAIVLDVVRQEFDAAAGSLHFLGYLGAGIAVGLVGGAVLAIAFRRRHLVPEGLENIFVLAVALTLFHLSNRWVPESGIAAVTVAGILLGNVKTHVHRDLIEFKEQLTVMFIGMLFILLAADVRLSDIRALGWPGVLTVLILIFVVRPLTVGISTWGSNLSVEERLFIGWIGPRGIVAAAVASLFANQLTAHPDALLAQSALGLRALVFLVIAVTVAVSGLSGGVVARWLGLKRPTDSGWVILGANALARALGRRMVDGGDEVVFIDTNHESTTSAQEEGFRVVFGNGLDEKVLTRAEIDTRVGVIAMSPNSEVNLLFIQKVREQARPKSLLLSTGAGTSLRPEMLTELGAQPLFGRGHDVDTWAVRLRHGTA
ncbi:MAG: cation:proton antiporter, partial [Planctomycetes bacterium]|nr:cation:proton antiporter [Planctomycetota bacterium]